MSRKTTKSFAGFLRAYGNDTPDRGFTLAEQLVPVVLVDDASGSQRRLSGPTIGTRLYRAALAGSYSIGAVQAGPTGIIVQKLHFDGNTRITVRNDTDGITANRAAVDPPVGAPAATTRTPQSRIYLGTAVADPNGGTEFMQFVTGDELVDLWIPPDHSLIVYSIAANLIVSAWLTYREGIDG